MGLVGSSGITGIDIGAGSIKVARIAPGRTPKLLTAGIIELPLEGADENLGAYLGRLCADKKLKSGNVVTQMPGKDLTIRSLTLPKMPIDELNEAVRWEAKRHISFPVDSALIEYLITGERSEGVVEKYDILMVAAEKDKVNAHLAPFAVAKLGVSTVDSNALALRNVLRNRGRFLEGNTAVIDIGAGKTEINIFNGTVLRFSRCLETGGLDMTRIVADSLAVTVQEAETLKQRMVVGQSSLDDPGTAAVRTKVDTLLMEIRRSIEYYKTTFREKGVERAVLTGGVSLMQGIVAYFTESLGMPIELDDPLAGLKCGDDLREEIGPFAARFSTAIGMALRKA